MALEKLTFILRKKISHQNVFFKNSFQPYKWICLKFYCIKNVPVSQIYWVWIKVKLILWVCFLFGLISHEIISLNWMIIKRSKILRNMDIFNLSLISKSGVTWLGKAPWDDMKKKAQNRSVSLLALSTTVYGQKSAAYAYEYQRHFILA